MKKDNRKTETRPEPLMTVEQVARLCNVSTKSVYRWVELGHLAVLRAGSQLRFRRRDVETYLARENAGPVASDRVVWP